MAEERFETTEKPLETAVKMALLEDKVEATQKELERTKKQLQDAETARDRAENARKYCVEQVEQHAAKDCAKIYWHNLQYTRKIKGLTTEIDMLKKKVKVLEASNTKRQEHEKSFRCVAVNVLPQSPESATASAAFSNTLSDHAPTTITSRQRDLAILYRLNTAQAAQLDPEVFRIIDGLRDENEALRRQNQELTASKEVLKARAELCRKVHDTETKDIFGDPSVCRILAEGGRCKRGKKCKYGRHPDGY